MNDKKIVIAPVGEFIDEIFVGIREFPTERVVLLTPQNMISEANRIEKDLDKFKIPVEIWKIKQTKSKAGLWEEIFKSISEIRKLESADKLVVHVSTGSRETRCAATSASFVNGIKAFAVDEGRAILLPVLKFNYYKLITERKMKLLKIIYEKDCCSSLDDLSKRAKMSLPLISYHINGNLKSEGLKDLGLVETDEEKGKVKIRLTTLGNLLLQGYLE